MLIDILFLVMIALAVFKGFRNGLIVAVFAIIAWILGIMAAFRFSDLAASYLKPHLPVSGGTLYIISFLLVMGIVMLIVNLGARLIEKTVALTPLGLINRIGGIFFYVLLYTLIFSVMVYFAEKVRLVNKDTISTSRVYPWVKPLAQVIQAPFLD